MNTFEIIIYTWKLTCVTHSCSRSSTQMWITALLLLMLTSITFLIYAKQSAKIIPVSVNYHITRLCNYGCGFCFHTKKTSTMATLDEAKDALQALSTAGMRKLNFAGGEPLLYPDFIGKLSKYCKERLLLESISIVTNGSLLTKSFFYNYGHYIDIIAVSCDSFNESVNKAIGRASTSSSKGIAHIDKLLMIREWCTEFNIKFKLNTVVNAYNFKEDMTEMVEKLGPFRWKCFQVLVLEGENAGEDALKDANRFTITTEQFESFVSKHQHLPCFVPEGNIHYQLNVYLFKGNDVMQNSYLILDENLCFLNCQSGKLPSQSLKDAPVQTALQEAGWDQKAFAKRGGVYDWQKTRKETCTDPKLEW